ncbi:MAG TPA: PEP/pyruvate-binding domain-containing protein, partial [Acidimicrobiales bacterium]
MRTFTDAMVPLDELTRADVEIAGGKGANLGELRHAGFPVPPGFVIPAPAYLRVLEENGLRDRLLELHRQAQAGADVQEIGSTARSLIEDLRLPDWFREAAAEKYRSLGDDVAVAVRSSATAEDTAEASFAGMNETFTNVRGVDSLLSAVVACWRSLYGDRVVAYRAVRGLDAEPAIAVVVQQMVAADRAGVMFSVDPATGAADRLVIEAAFGLGEVVVSGQVEPDTYVVDRSTRRILSARVGLQTHRIVSGPDGDAREELPPEQGGARVLSDDEVLALAELGERVEQHYGTPQDMEWAYVGDTLYLLQSRPITTLPSQDGRADGDVLVSGLGASPGVAVGRVRVLRDVTQGSSLRDGEVLVAT